MPEERKATTFNPRPVEGQRQNGQNLAERSDDNRRVALIQWVILIGTVLSIGTIVFYVLLYAQTRMWQILADGGGLVLALVCLAPAHLSARRGRLDAAGYWLLLALVIPYVASELVWADETLLNVIGGVSLIFLVGNIVLRRKWRSWLVAGGLYLILVFLINQFEPLSRRNAITESTVLYYFDLGLTILLVLAALWLIFRALRAETIRARLLVAFTLVVLVPVAITSVSLAVGGVENDRQAIVNQLELVATFKETVIQTWLATLQTDLSAVLSEEDTAQYVFVLLRQSPNSEAYQDARNELLTDFMRPVEQTQRFEKLFLINSEGEVVLSTDATQEGQNYFGYTFFQRGLEDAQAHLTWDLNRLWLDSVRPIVDEQGQVIGVLTGRASLEMLNELMLVHTGLGETGETYLINAERAVLTGLRSGERIPYMPADSTYAAIVEKRVDGTDMYDNYHSVPVVGIYHWISELRVALLVEQEQEEAFRPTYAMLATSGGGGALVALVSAIIVSLIITRSIASPLANLAKTAALVAAGDLERTAEVKRDDEIGALAQSFNSMTVQIRDVISGLEQRVAERTHELELRSTYMEASAEVGHAVSSILDADLLIRQVVDLIRERFGLYYVGLFLTDEASEWAVLRAGTGEAGRAMLARGHRLKIGLEGMIGWSIANAQARIALYAEEDTVRTATAELPDTRSEAALPLRSRGRVLGALTIQHDQPNAFDDDTIAVLQTMADQVAVALDNARLFTESQAALEATRRAYSELRREAWTELIRARPDLGFRSHAGGVTPAGDIWRTDMEQALQGKRTIQGDGTGDGEKLPLVVPIKVRDDVIGVLDTYKPAEAGEWTSEEITLLETLADQLGEALESARLYQDTQRRAAREQLTREITDKMRRATSIEDIVRTAVDELFGTMRTSRAFVRLGATPPARSKGAERTRGQDDEETG